MGKTLFDGLNIVEHKKERKNKIMNTGAVLKSISVTGKVAGGLFLNEIEQVFVNDGDSNVEFIYTFPMPENASVSSFSAAVGGERFIGVVKKKDQALEEYKYAVAAGDSAYMLESHRDNIFQASLGNVAKGEEVAIDISYIQDAAVTDNELRLLIPTLVSPRYIPGEPIGLKTGMGYSDPTGQVPDADFITPIQGDASYKVNYNLVFDMDSNIKNISSPSHDIVAKINGGKGTVVLNQAQLNSDFVLNVSLYAGKSEKFIRSKKTDHGYFSYVSFIPRLKPLPETSKEFAFMIDVSGSMYGGNLESAKKALRICLRNLMPGDVFNIIAFDDSLECFAIRGTEFNEKSFKMADLWIDSLYAKGGTETLLALRYSVESMKNANEKEKIIMLLTDGQVGNESEIIKYAKESFAGRLFCVGIDFNINDSFINKLSAVGNGFAEYYYPGSDEDLVGKIVRQFARSNAAYLRDVKFESNCELEAAGNPPECVYSDEFYNVVLKSDSRIDTLYVTGTTGGTVEKLELLVTDANGDSTLLSKLWAKKKLAELEFEALYISPRHENLIVDKMVEISEKYGVICHHTSFVAFNKRDDRQSDLPKAVAVPVNAPKRNSGASGLTDVLLFSESVPIPMDPMMKRIRRDLDTDIFTESVDLRSINEAISYAYVNSFSQAQTQTLEAESNQQQVTKAHEMKALIMKLNNDAGDREDPISEAEFNDSAREVIIELANNSDHIDFPGCFDELDLVMSSVEHFVGKGDSIFDDCYQKLVKLLDDCCILDDESLSISDIAEMQNYDGSFCQCSPLKKKYSPIALQRLTTDGDSFLYDRQIKKLNAYLQRTETSVGL